MDEPPEEFYSEERWQNWIGRVRDTELDPEEEDSARLLLNLQDDVAIAIAKIIRAYEDTEMGAEEALGEIDSIREIVLADPDISDEDTAILVDGVQTSLVCALYAAEQYIDDGVADETDIEGYLRAAADAEAQEEFDRALGLAACAGTQIIDGEELDIAITEELEYGLVTEWINGLDSLQSALSDPEVIEEE
ncbi:MAG: DUF2150 family protein [Halobacteriales archaeon]|nr:DUF2150 family protein [Halobacteriales archaeon]